MNIYEEVEQILDDIELPTGFELRLLGDFTEFSTFHRYYLQVRCWRKDTITGEMGWGYGGKAYLSPHMVKSEVVQTAFGLYKAYLEHEARETFKYRGKRVYGPHINVDALWEVAQRVEVRAQAPTPAVCKCSHTAMNHQVVVFENDPSACLVSACGCSIYRKKDA